MSTIPVIDFGRVGLHQVNMSDVEFSEVESTGRAICDAFSGIGFCYLSNHGIADKLIQEMFTVSKDFFGLSRDMKNKFLRSKDVALGYIALEQEFINPERPGDYKEAFNCRPYEQFESNWPTEELPAMRDIFHRFFQSAKELADRILFATSVGLDLKDKMYLVNTHRLIGKPGNKSMLRSLGYPLIDRDLKPGQLRCGEHSDYGSITLLFQDDIGGLEVMDTNGTWVPATPIPGTILINIGDAMQMWTADRLKATKHRVIVPEEEVKKKQNRQSIAFFVHPDDDVIFECLDGSNKYEPISSKDYLAYKMSITY